MALVVFIMGCVVRFQVTHLTEICVSVLWDRLRSEVSLHSVSVRKKK